jgi:hypothetical protein
MDPYNGDIHQALKWLQNKAPNLNSLIDQKAKWYSTNQDQFWSNWEDNVFDLTTVNSFGIAVWCIILGVPSSLFGLYPDEPTSWAFGPDRQNFIYAGGDPGFQNPNETGGNFFGGGNSTILNLKEARWILRLRYLALVSNGNVSFTNYMLRLIMNDGEPWDFPGKKYFYVTDSTSPSQTLTPSAPITDDFHIQYRIGANFIVSDQFVNTLNLAQYGLIPVGAGVSYEVIKES